jgi:putative drug exporter of the RND superfamily
MARTESAASGGVLARWARVAVRRRRLVLAAWLAALALIIGFGVRFGGSFDSSFSIPGTESQAAFDLLTERFPQRAGDSATLVFQADGGVTAPDARPQIESVLAQAAALPGVVEVQSPFGPGGERQIAPDGRIAYAVLQYGEQSNAIPAGHVERLLDLVDESSTPAVTVEAGGQVVQFNEQEPPGTSELIGVVAAVFILLIAFGSVVAMGLPITTAIVGLLTSVMLILISTRFLGLPVFAPQFAAMIGLGVGIDYALLVVTRYRESLGRGNAPEEAVVEAVSTAGRSVLFAGAVVVIALLGMLAIGIPFIGALGIAGAIVVSLAVVVALTLLPALLAFAGRAIDRWSIPWLHADESDSRSGIWYRFSLQIQRRPWLWALSSFAVLLALALPALRINLGFSDAGNGSDVLHSRRAYDLLAQGFGPGFNGPLTVVLDTRAAGEGAEATVARAREAVAAAPGVVQVSPPIPSPGGDTALLLVYPATSPQDEATADLIHTLRDGTLPAAVGGSGVRAYVAGPVAAFIDIGDRITERMPVFFGAVIGLSFLLLMVVFRSLLVPLKAAVMNLLSIGAAYGVLVLVFQEGVGAGLIGVKEGPIEVFLPMMLFAILFGLSMDYEVFLISRIREEYLHSRNNADSVAHGLSVTARVITAAAAIMVAVFISFVLGPQRVIKEFGIGLATAIFIDATIVRLILVPATMALLGDANWWLPRWLDRALPHLDLEGPAPAQGNAVPAAGDQAAIDNSESGTRLPIADRLWRPAKRPD